MSQYLQRVYIDPNQDVLTGTPSQYGQRVHIVEILNSDGTPWEPIPAYDELECVSKTNTSGSVVLGSTRRGGEAAGAMTTATTRRCRLV